MPKNRPKQAQERTTFALSTKESRRGAKLGRKKPSNKQKKQKKGGKGGR